MSPDEIRQAAIWLEWFALDTFESRITLNDLAAKLRALADIEDRP